MPVMLVLVATPAVAKRAPAPHVPPVEHNGIRYIAPNHSGRRPTLQAWDIQTRTMLWEVVVYHNRIVPLLEEDVQWVLIEKLEVIEGELVVTNERGKTYRVDLKTGRVKGVPWLRVVAVLVAASLVALVVTWRIRGSKPS